MITFEPPVPGAITQGPHPEHEAYDFACVRGQPVRAVHDGYGTHYWSSRMGWVFVHRFGEAKSIYAHLQEPAPAGYYNQGDVIGICGSSGAWSTGPHVHFEHNQPYTF